MNKRLSILMVLLLHIIFSLFAQVTPTNEWVNFFSKSTTLNGTPIPIGTTISAYDPDGVLCGAFGVHTEGHYGFLAVYRDDSFSTDIDEGAEPGDTLIFMINHHYALLQGPGIPVWTSNGDVIELNLEAHSNYAPVIIGLPDSMTFCADSSIILYLNDYVKDMNDPDSALHWTISGNDSLNVDLDDSLNIVIISAPVHWSGTKTLIFTVMDDSSAWDSDTIIVQVLGIVGVQNDFSILVPKKLSLSQNYPNPFNSSTTMRFQIPKSGWIRLTIYDSNGRLVAQLSNQLFEPGLYSYSWDGTNQFGEPVTSGIYFYHLSGSSVSKAGKMILLR